MIAFFIPYATWVAGSAAAYFVFKIAEAQKSPVAWLWALSQVIPFVGLVCLLFRVGIECDIVGGGGEGVRGAGFPCSACSRSGRITSSSTRSTFA